MHTRPQRRSRPPRTGCPAPRGATPQDEFGLVLRPELTLPQRAQRAFNLFGFGHVLPATSEGRGHGRTPYFHRLMAIRFAQDARHPLTRYLAKGGENVFEQLARSYLATYRKMKGL